MRCNELQEPLGFPLIDHDNDYIYNNCFSSGIHGISIMVSCFSIRGICCLADYRRGCMPTTYFKKNWDWALCNPSLLSFSNCPVLARNNDARCLGLLDKMVFNVVCDFIDRITLPATGQNYLRDQRGTRDQRGQDSLFRGGRIDGALLGGRMLLCLDLDARMKRVPSTTP